MRAQCVDGLRRIRFDGIGHGDDARELAVHSSQHRRLALCCQAFHIGDDDVQILTADAGHANIQPVDEVGVAHGHGVAVHGAGHAEPGMGLECLAVRIARRETALRRFGNDRRGQGMFRIVFGSGGERQ